jgi:knotted carbamoyltransferase YgeW
MTASIDQSLQDLGSLDFNLFQGDFLHTWNHTEQELRAVLATAEILDTLYRKGVSTRLFQSGLAIAIFRDQSTRTRYSFASATNLLGLSLQELEESKSQIAHGETVRETANMVSFLTEVIGIRDDIFLGEGHTYMSQVANAVQEGFDQGVLPQRPAVVNLQCDLDHPTQSMADLMHLKRRFGSLEELRSKKIAMTWAYSPSYGKPLSVPQGIITLMSRFGMNVVLAHPSGYGLVTETIEKTRQYARESDGSFTVAHSMEEAFADADIVYPKSWAPYHVMERRTQLLKNDLAGELRQLEAECLAQNAEFRNWECNASLMASTRNGRALYMHCLPADVSGVSCKTGEVSAEVFEQGRLDTYREASLKPFVIAALILLTRMKQPIDALRHLTEQAAPRRLT